MNRPFIFSSPPTLSFLPLVSSFSIPFCFFSCPLYYSFLFPFCEYHHPLIICSCSAHKPLMNCMAGLWPHSPPLWQKIRFSFLIDFSIHSFSHNFIPAFLHSNNVPPFISSLIILSLHRFSLISSFLFFRLAHPHLAHNMFVKCSDDFWGHLLIKKIMSESGGFFFAHKSLINIPWAAHKYAYMPAQFSGLATI